MIDDIQELVNASPYSDQLNEYRYTQLYSELAHYYFRRNRHEEGIQTIMICLQNAVNNNSVKTVITCVALFEKYRQYASQEDVSQYDKLREEIQRRPSYE